MSRGGTLLRNYPLPPNQGPQCQTTSWQPASSLTHGAGGQLRIRESCGSPWTIPPSSSTKPNWCRSVTNCCLSLREGVVENVRLEKLTHSFRHCNPLSRRSSADKHHGTEEEEKRSICRENATPQLAVSAQLHLQGYKTGEGSFHYFFLSISTSCVLVVVFLVLLCIQKQEEQKLPNCK